MIACRQPTEQAVRVMAVDRSSYKRGELANRLVEFADDLFEFESTIRRARIQSTVLDAAVVAEALQRHAGLVELQAAIAFALAELAKGWTPIQPGDHMDTSLALRHDRKEAAAPLVVSYTCERIDGPKSVSQVAIKVVPPAVRAEGTLMFTVTKEG